MVALIKREHGGGLTPKADMSSRETDQKVRRLKAGLAIWAVTSVVGVGVVAIPDEGTPLISLSDSHGPSAGDMVGVALILVGWSAFLRALWSMRSMVTHSLILLLFAFGGAVTVFWSVATDTGSWWVVGAVILVAVQVAAAVSAVKASSGEV